MITKNETREPVKIHGLYRHDSGAIINYYEDDDRFQCTSGKTLQLGYGYGATPLEAIEDAIRSLKEFDKDALIRDLEQFAEEMRVSAAKPPRQVSRPTAARKCRSRAPRQVSRLMAARKGRAPEGAVEAADAA